MDEDKQEPQDTAVGSEGQPQPKAVVGHFDYPGIDATNSPPGSTVSPTAESATLQPQEASDPYIGLTGSSLPEAKRPMPKGVYAIVGFVALGIIGSFFDSSQLSAVYTIGLVVSLLVAAGLLFRREIARKAMVILAVLSVVVYGVTLLMLFGLQQRIDSNRARYEAAISQVDEQALTRADRAQLNSMKAQLAAAERQAGRAIAISFIGNGVYIAMNIAILIYLTRPKVKEVFLTNE